MNLGRSIATKILAKTEFDFDFRVLGQTPQGGWLLATVNSRASRLEKFAHFFPDQTDLLERTERALAAAHPKPSASAAVIVLNANLQQIDTWSLPPDWHTVSAVSRNLRWSVRSTPVEFLLHDRSTEKTRRFPHRGWRTYTGSDAYFDQSHRLWCVFPGSEGKDVLTVIEPESASVVYEVPFANGQGHTSIQQGPEPNTLLLEIACGQDGCDVFLAREQSATIGLSRMDLLGRTNVSFAPGGREFVTGSHDDNQVKAHSFPECKELLSLPGEVIFGDDEINDDQIGYHAIYLDAGHILVDTRYGRLIVIRRSDLKVLGTIWPDGFVLEKQTWEGGVEFRANGLLKGLASAGKILMALTGGQLLLVEVIPEKT